MSFGQVCVSKYRGIPGQADLDADDPEGFVAK